MRVTKKVFTAVLILCMMLQISGAAVIADDAVNRRSTEISDTTVEKGGDSVHAADIVSVSVEGGNAGSSVSGASASAAGGESVSSAGGVSASAAGGESVSSAGGASASAAGGEGLYLRLAALPRLRQTRPQQQVKTHFQQAAKSRMHNPGERKNRQQTRVFLLGHPRLNRKQSRIVQNCRIRQMKQKLPALSAIVERPMTGRKH